MDREKNKKQEMNLVGKKNKKQEKFSYFSVIFQGMAFYILIVVIIAGIIMGLKLYKQEKDVDVLISNAGNVKLGDTIILNFSTKMLERSVEESMKIEPALKIKTSWENSNIFSITLLEPPFPETTYELTIDGAKTQFYVPQQKFTKKITSTFIPELREVYPSDGQEDIDVSDHITIDFDRAIKDPFNMEVKIVPMTTKFNHKFNDSGTQLIITPEEKMDKKTQYTINLQLKHNYLDFSREIYQGSFTTKFPPPVFYNYAKNNEPVKTEERLEEVEPQILEGKYIDIDLSSQTMFIFNNGKEEGAFKVSSGKWGMDTPKGTFKVMAKAKRPWSKKYGLYMPWFIQFTNQGHGIHELPEWPSGYKEGTNHLGIPVSHGCVRLGIGTAKTVYDFATVGMLIVIHS